jgi:large subunit ribosomal protein L24
MVKVGDKVLVIAGDDKGKEGTVTKIIRDKNKVVVSGINIVVKHIKPSAYNENGGRVEMEAPIHISNVKVVANDKKETKKAEKTTKAEPKKTAKKSTKKESGDK